MLGVQIFAYEVLTVVNLNNYADWHADYFLAEPT